MIYTEKYCTCPLEWRVSLVLLWCVMCAYGCQDNTASSGHIASKVKEVISVGMDLDTAIDKLEDEGITVGPKQQSTKSGYYQVNVPLKDAISDQDGLRYAVGAEAKGDYYIIIKADKSGQIVSID